MDDWPQSPDNDHGLLGVRERVEMVGGSLHIASAPDQGTTIRAEIPLTNDRTGGALRPLPDPNCK